MAEFLSEANWDKLKKSYIRKKITFFLQVIIN